MLLPLPMPKQQCSKNSEGNGVVSLAHMDSFIDFFYVFFKYLRVEFKIVKDVQHMRL